jgi:hypothetical protein
MNMVKRGRIERLKEHRGEDAKMRKCGPNVVIRTMTIRMDIEWMLKSCQESAFLTSDLMF